mgnify:FL=1
MDELVLNNRRLKLVDGEIYAWKPTKNPYWCKVKYSISDGYYTFNLRYNKIKKNYRVHRLIYKFYNPEWNMTYTPDNQIDHIDNNRNNNNIENLRIVNNSENSQNRPLSKGYTWNKKQQKYVAQITINYKNYYLGYYDTIDEAREAYLNAKEKHHTH